MADLSLWPGPAAAPPAPRAGLQRPAKRRGGGGGGGGGGAPGAAPPGTEEYWGQEEAGGGVTRRGGGFPPRARFRQDLSRVEDQRPFQTGSRFSAKARAPSS